LGIARLVAELNKDDLEGWMFWYADINFLHFAIFLFVICTVVLAVVSLLTPAPSLEQIEGLTIGAISDDEKAVGTSGWRKTDGLLSVILFVIVGALWFYFS
jgi:SSS family solute:Na+ symporter